MKPGDFDQAARDAIMEASGHQCVGCGRTQPLNTQHRVARGMGGTRSSIIGHPSNGVILCGSGTIGCHGWCEGHPVIALDLGWRTQHRALHAGWNGDVWWTRFGWKLWTEDLAVIMIDDVDVPNLAERMPSISAYMAWRDRGGVLA